MTIIFLLLNDKVLRYVCPFDNDSDDDDDIADDDADDDENDNVKPLTDKD